jgi:hypothetical protein
MSKPVFRIFFLLMMMAFICSVYAQKGSISIYGKITAADDKDPIPHASISIDRKGFGTATNASGNFALIIPAANLADSLKISCIGFKTARVAIAGLKNEQELNIALEKNTTELKEISIIYYEPLKIIQKAIDRIPQNYINNPHILRGFYRMYTYADSIPLQLSEAVFDVYNFGYGDKHADLFRLIKARNERNDRDFSFLELGQKPNSIFEEDLVNHLYTSGFLSEKGIKLHQFDVKGVVDFKGYQAYEIVFKEKPGATDGTYRGRMFIDTKTHAFIDIEFGLTSFGLTDMSYGNFITHSLIGIRGVTIGLKRDNAQVSYQEVGNKWVLASVAGNNLLTIKNDEAGPDLVANVKYNYQVTAVDTVAKETFNSKIGRSESINNHHSNGDPKFWKDYNILLSDYDTEGIFAHIQAINKLAKSKK